jgi:hypothetical protein
VSKLVLPNNAQEKQKIINGSSKSGKVAPTLKAIQSNLFGLARNISQIGAQWKAVKGI